MSPTLRTLLAAFMLVLLNAVPPHIASAAPRQGSATISVSALVPWTDTGLNITQYDWVRISASGVIKIAGSDPGKTPDGESGCVAGSTYVAPGLTCWSLIGRIGSGAPFQVGSNKGFFAAGAGRLYLGVNDETVFFGDNSGSWSATVTTSPMQTELFGNPHETYAVVVGGGTDCSYASTKCAKKGWYHTGQDSSGTLTTPIHPSASGIVRKIVANDPRGKGCPKMTPNCQDHGMGNTVIIEHALVGQPSIFTQYSHLSAIDGSLQENQCVVKATTIGTMGRSGYGDPNYYKKGSPHLHLEFKTASVIGAPGAPDTYWGYTPGKLDPPDFWGYRDPKQYLGLLQALVCAP